MQAIGIDIGTSGAKGLLVSFPDGEVVKSHRVAYRLLADGNRAEHDPEDWVRAALEILETLGPADAIGLDGMMHSEVCLGPDPLHEGEWRHRGNAILWCDGRAQAQCDEIVARVGLETLRETVANRPFAGFTLPHLLAREELGPVLVCKDYVRLRLTGERRQEVSDAAGTLCWDVARGRWSTELLRKLGIDPSLFAPACGSSEVVGRWNGVPVVGGAADNAAAAVGVGVVRDAQAMVSMGTSNVLLVVHDRPVVDREMRVHTFTHAVPSRFVQLGCMLTGTRAFDWACRLLGVAVEDAEVAESAEGVLFAPYLVGERTPYADTSLRGMFAGLSPDHTGAHLLRAVLEGTAFALRDAHEIMGGDSVRVTGGGMKNALWRQIVADVLGVPVLTVNTSDEGAAYGAAILAAVGVGEFRSIEEACDRLVRESTVTRPQRSYDAEYARFRRLYPAAKSLA
jgi:xylulokinase